MMATVSQKRIEPTGLWFTFTPEQRRRMMDEDIEAGKRVSAVLMTVITIGLLLGIVTVALILS